MIIGPALYDLKRGLLRLSVLVILSLFIISGVGLTYLIHSFLITRSTPVINHLVLVEADLGKETLYIEGVVYIRPYNPLSGEMEYQLACFNMTKLQEKLGLEAGKVYAEEDVDKFIREEGILIAEGRIGFSSEFQHARRINRTEIPELYACRSKYSFITAFVIATYYNYLDVMRTSGKELILHGVLGNSLVELYFTNASSDVLFPVAHNRLGKLVISYGYRDGEKYRLLGAALIPSMKDVPINLYIKEADTPNPVIIRPGEIEEKFHKIATINQGLFLVEVEAKIVTHGKYGYDIVAVASSNQTTLHGIGRAPPYMFFEVPTRDPREVLLIQAMSGSVGIGLLMLIFPIVMLYLGYVYIAKPRSQGALEFVLARPITRLDLYITRYIAGVLVALVATALFYISLVLSIWIIFGVLLEPTVYALLYLGTVLSLVAFYSLCYFLASISRGARYLALSIFVYLFFTMIINIVQAVIVALLIREVPAGEVGRVYTDISYIVKYFNPLGAIDFASYYVNKYLGLDTLGLAPSEGIINPLFVTLSILAWITIPVILGWILFKKANLQA